MILRARSDIARQYQSHIEQSQCIRIVSATFTRIFRDHCGGRPFHRERNWANRAEARKSCVYFDGRSAPRSVDPPKSRGWPAAGLPRRRPVCLSTGRRRHDGDGQVFPAHRRHGAPRSARRLHAGATPQERGIRHKVAGKTLTCRWFDQVPSRDGPDARIVDRVGVTLTGAKAKSPTRTPSGPRSTSRGMTPPTRRTAPWTRRRAVAPRPWRRAGRHGHIPATRDP